MTAFELIKILCVVFFFFVMISETVWLVEFALKKCSECLITQGVNNHILLKYASSHHFPPYQQQYSKHLFQFSDQSWLKTDL